MFRALRHESILRPESLQLNGECYLSFPLEGVEAWTDLSRRQGIEEGLLKALWRDFFQVQDVLEEHLLSTDDVLICEECIFRDAASGRFRFLCFPNRDGDVRREWTELWERMISEFDHRDRRLTGLIYTVRHALASGRNWSEIRALAEGGEAHCGRNEEELSLFHGAPAACENAGVTERPVSVRAGELSTEFRISERKDTGYGHRPDAEFFSGNTPQAYEVFGDFTASEAGGYFEEVPGADNTDQGMERKSGFGVRHVFYGIMAVTGFAVVCFGYLNARDEIFSAGILLFSGAIVYAVGKIRAVRHRKKKRKRNGLPQPGDYGAVIVTENEDTGSGISGAFDAGRDFPDEMKPGSGTLPYGDRRRIRESLHRNKKPEELQETGIMGNGDMIFLISGEEEIPVHGNRFTIGSSPDNDFVLKHPYISRHHVCFFRHASGYMVRDLGSTNGSRLNGQRLSAEREYALSRDDILELADITYRVV